MLVLLSATALCLVLCLGMQYLGLWCARPPYLLPGRILMLTVTIRENPGFARGRPDVITDVP